MSTEKLTYSREWTDAEAFPRLGFTKNWENPEDYPTIETDEAKVREDMQSLHDETKDYINETLIPAILAEDATEEARTAAESTREENERSRVQAEQTRVSNENARIQAEAAREAKVYEKFPYVGENGNWREWDESAGAFVDSGVQAQGKRGTGILKVTTEPETRRHHVGNNEFVTRWVFETSKVLEESGASEVLVGDIIQHGSDHYLVSKVTSYYVYSEANPTSIKGDAFTYGDFTEAQLEALSQSIAADVLNAANLCYVAVAVPASDVGKDGDVCVVLE